MRDALARQFRAEVYRRHVAAMPEEVARMHLVASALLLDQQQQTIVELEDRVAELGQECDLRRRIYLGTRAFLKATDLQPRCKVDNLLRLMETWGNRMRERDG